MNKEENIEKIKHMKNYFFITFWVSFVLLLFSALMCIVLYDNQVAFAEKFFNLESEDYSYILVLLMGLWKILIVQFTLISAIALWLIERTCSCCKCK